LFLLPPEVIAAVVATETYTLDANFIILIPEGSRDEALLRRLLQYPGDEVAAYLAEVCAGPAHPRVEEKAQVEAGTRATWPLLATAAVGNPEFVRRGDQLLRLFVRRDVVEMGLVIFHNVASKL
jgi:hypothetical protein